MNVSVSLIYHFVASAEWAHRAKIAIRCDSRPMKISDKGHGVNGQDAMMRL